MSRKRHEITKRAKGGGVKPVWNAGEGQNAAKEAEERKRGGRVHHHGEGEEPKHRADRRARGGRMHEKHEEHEHEHHAKRAKGGRVRGEGAGADMRPLTTASKVRHVTKDETPEPGIPSD